MQEVESRYAELVRERLSRLLPLADPGLIGTAQPCGPAPGPAARSAPDPADREQVPGRVGPDVALGRGGRDGAPGSAGRDLPLGPVDAEEAPGASGLAVAGGACRSGTERGAAGRLSAGAFDPGRRGVRALAAVAVLVVIGAALLAWRSRPRSEPVAAVPIAVATAAPAATAAGSGAAAEVVVTVAGKVRRAGLVRLPAGARVGDALAAAGGVLPGVDAALLNPARKITDGELILVGVTAPAVAPVPAGGPAPPGGPGAPAAQPGGRISLNTATLAQLDTLPGVGPVLAQRILAHRDGQGGFRSVADLRQVEGIGQARYEQLKDLVSL